MDIEMTTIPAGLADYAAERGYIGTPRIVEIIGKGGWRRACLVDPTPTPERLIELRESQSVAVTGVSIAWDRGGPADFNLHELLPWTGIRGNPASFPVAARTTTRTTHGGLT